MEWIQEIVKWCVIIALITAGILYVIFPQHQQPVQVIQEWHEAVNAGVILVALKASSKEEAIKWFTQHYEDYVIIDAYEGKEYILIKARKK